MSVRFALLATIVACALACLPRAQATERPSPIGTWRGTSLCLVRPSACHDETVVYRITRTSTRDSLALDGRKIIGGKEVPMGVLACRYDEKRMQLVCTLPMGVWTFTLRGDSLLGELRHSDGTRFRDVRTARSR